MLEPHDYCKHFPPLGDEALAIKAADIKASGLQPEIVLYEDRVLDDYSVYVACLKAGVEPRFADFTGDSPIEFAVRRNIADQVFTDSQKATFAFDALPPYEAEAKENQRLGKGNAPDPGQSRDKVAALFGISGGTVGRVKKVAGLMPEILPLLRAGDLTVNKAAKYAKALTRLTHDERQALCDAGVEALEKATAVEVPALEYLTGGVTLLEQQPDDSVVLFLATDSAGMEVATRKLTPDGILLCYGSQLPHPAIKGLKQWCEFGINLGRLWRPLIGHTKSKRERPVWYAERLQEEELLRRLLKPPDDEDDEGLFGFGEWTKYKFNCFTGCEHNCIYCGSRGTLLAFGTDCTNWGTMVPREGVIEGTLAVPHRNKLVAFPTAHDITPANVDLCIKYGHKLLDKGNRWLWTTKPHLEVAKRMCAEFAKEKNRIEMRFTITSLDPEKSKFWEPKGTLPEERIVSAKYATDAGYVTSVSDEPALDLPRIVDLYNAVKFVSGDVWIGTLNRPRNNNRNWRDFDAEIKAIEAEHTPPKLRMAYETLKGEPKIRWKNTFLKKAGLV